MLTSQTLLISSWPWNLFGKHVSLFSFSPLCLDITKLWLEKSAFATLSLTLLKVINLPSQLFPVFYAVVGVSGSQKDDNVWVMDRVLIVLLTSPPSVGVGGRKSQNNGLVTGSLLFSSPHLALSAQCLVRLAWLIKRLLCRITRIRRTLDAEISIPSLHEP